MQSQDYAYNLRGWLTSINSGFLSSASANTVISGGGQTLLAGLFSQIDNLSYTYGDSNRLKKVTDGGYVNKGFIYANSGNARDYEYDKNGNLTADRNKGITNITYNYLNLPQVITFTGNRTITFIYDASGAKLRKIVNNNGAIDTYDYVNGVEYKNTVLQRIAHTVRKDSFGEGSVSVQVGGSFAHEYVLRDHLGNTRVTFTDINNDGIVATADIKQINHYYPFGMNMEGNFNGTAGSNKYQYNGKEWNDDFSLGWNDYGARFYDPAIARWSVIDMKSEKYNNITPYAYVANMPIKAIDPDGKEIVVPNKDDRGRVLEMINSKSAGTFAFNDAGKLYQINAVNDKKTGSSYYQEKLNAAIKSDLKIEIQIANKYNEPKLASPDGKTLIKNGTDKEIDVSKAGEGSTYGWEKTNQLVTITGKEYTDSNHSE